MIENLVWIAKGQPDPADRHVDKLLTSILIAYMNEETSYIADRLFPIVNVTKQSDLIPEYDKDTLLRDVAQLRAPGTRSEGAGYNVVKTKSYFCHNYATNVPVTDEARANVDDPFNVDDISTMIIAHRLLLRREIAWVADFFKSTVWANDVTPTNLWDDYALSVPLTDIDAGRTAIHKASAKEPSDFTMGQEVWMKLRHHPDFIERIKYTQRAILTPALVAELLEIPRINVGKAIKITSAEGAAHTTDYIFGKHALLTYVPNRPSLMLPSAGYTFSWSALGRGINSYVRRLRLDFEMTDILDGHTFFDQKSIATDMGYFMPSVIS